MNQWTRCEYETDDFACSKLADVEVKGYGPVCLDHMGDAQQCVSIRRAVVEKSATQRKIHRTEAYWWVGEWVCPYCGTENPDETKAGRLGFCRKCMRAREMKG